MLLSSVMVLSWLATTVVLPSAVMVGRSDDGAASEVGAEAAGLGVWRTGRLRTSRDLGSSEGLVCSTEACRTRTGQLPFPDNVGARDLVVEGLVLVVPDHPQVADEEERHAEERD